MAVAEYRLYCAIFWLCIPLTHGFRAHVITGSREQMTRINNSTNRFLANWCGRSEPTIKRTGVIENYPWAVSITKKGKNRLGGVIISPLHVLTAAHPFMKFKGHGESPCELDAYRSFDELRSRFVTYGGKCIRGAEPDLPNHPMCEASDMNRVKIRSVLVDADFPMNGCTEGHDWAVVELETPLVFNDRVRPICLPHFGQAFKDILTIVGWGRNNSFYESHPYIQETPMRLDPDCRAPWSDTMPTKVSDYVCTKALNTEDYATPRICYGGSGSGMQQKDREGRATLMGITSFGSKGCPANELARFTRVDKYLYEICVITGVCYSLDYLIKPQDLVKCIRTVLMIDLALLNHSDSLPFLCQICIHFR